MKNGIKKAIAGLVSISIIGASTITFAATYEVKPGDTYWKISQNYKVDINRLMEVNNANQNSILYVGDNIIIPDDEEYSYYEVKSGDTPWKISEKFNVNLEELLKVNGLNQYSYIYIGQKLKIPLRTEIVTPEQPNYEVTYITHTVEKGDDFWVLSQKYGITMNELLRVNNANSNTVLYIGEKVKIPVHHVPVMETLGAKYGEYLDWWKGVQYVIPMGSIIEVTDFYTGVSFIAKRTLGANHADVETLTADDTNILKDIYGGSFSWKRRPVIVEYNGRKIAASMSGMPHAGNDSSPGGYYTSWRSDSYGPGTNFDYVKNNGMDGHFDIHFLNSTRHVDGEIDDTHQENIKKAAGIIR